MRDRSGAAKPPWRRRSTPGQRGRNVPSAEKAYPLRLLRRRGRAGHSLRHIRLGTNDGRPCAHRSASVAYKDQRQRGAPAELCDAGACGSVDLHGRQQPHLRAQHRLPENRDDAGGAGPTLGDRRPGLGHDRARHRSRRYGRQHVKASRPRVGHLRQWCGLLPAGQLERVQLLPLGRGRSQRAQADGGRYAQARRLLLHQQ